MSSLLLGYLSDFAYYCSLCDGEKRAALIRLPPSGRPASADRLVAAPADPPLEPWRPSWRTCQENLTTRKEGGSGIRTLRSHSFIYSKIQEKKKKKRKYKKFSDTHLGMA